MNLLKLLARLRDKFEKKSSRIFWEITMVLALSFSSLDEKSMLDSKSLESQTSVSTLSSNQLSRGGDFGMPPTGSGFSPSSDQGRIDRGPDQFEDSEPNLRLSPGLSGSSSSSGSGSMGDPRKANKIPDVENWESNPGYWDEKSADTCNEDEEPYEARKVDFPYELDANNNPTLLINTINKTREKRRFNKVGFDQAASHIQHAPELGLVLPTDFNMKKYMGMNKADKIKYAKAKLPREFIISYQNEIGNSLQPIFGLQTRNVFGSAGKFKNEVEMIFQQNPKDPNQNRISVINDKGVQV